MLCLYLHTWIWCKFVPILATQLQNLSTHFFVSRKEMRQNYNQCWICLSKITCLFVTLLSISCLFMIKYLLWLVYQMSQFIIKVSMCLEARLENWGWKCQIWKFWYVTTHLSVSYIFFICESFVEKYLRFPKWLQLLSFQKDSDLLLFYISLD